MNQHLIRTSFPTSHGFEPFPREDEKKIFNPLLTGPSSKSKFEILFEYVATIDVSPYLCIAEALKFREEVCNGEEAIMQYCQSLSNQAGEKGAQLLGTEFMQNQEGTLTKCLMINVRLPLSIGPGGDVPQSETYAVAVWMTISMAEEQDMYSPVFIHGNKFWTRWSAQVYLELEDFVKGAEVLKVMCKRVKKGEYLDKEEKIAKSRL